MTVRTLQCFLVQALDMNILQSIVDGEHENRLGQWQQREELRREASEMLNDFREQIRLEKEKEEEVDAMFQSVVSPCDLERERETEWIFVRREEAAKEWSRREQQWQREKEAREKLMRQVIREREEQVMHKLQALHIEQEQNKEETRMLIDDMQQTRMVDLAQQQRLIEQKEHKQRDLKKQVTFSPCLFSHLFCFRSPWPKKNVFDLKWNHAKKIFSNENRRNNSIN